MKKKVFKILFFISFLPIIILIFISIYYAIKGHDVYTLFGGYIKTEYGIEAFLNTLFWNGLSFTIIPILPIMALYQIIYIIVNIVKKFK